MKGIVDLTNSPSMPRKDRLRRVVILCCHFGRNLAYYRVGQSEHYRHLFDPAKTASANFWRMANSDFLDMCVLEWCKLLADEKGQHHWRKIVTDRTVFKANLLNHLQLNEAALQQYIDTMRTYRDKFVAHLDSDLTMSVPKLDVAKRAVWFYHAHIVRQEATPEDLAGLGVKLDEGYALSEDEARRVFSSAGRTE